MIIAVYVALLCSAVFGVVAPMIARRLVPRVATWMLTAGALVAASSWLAALGLLAFTLVAQNPIAAARGHWSGPAFAHTDPVSVPTALAALVVVVVCVVRLLGAVVSRARAVRQAHALAAALPLHGGELAVVDDPVPLACTVPGRPGRIVLSTGLLRVLDAQQRRAVLAHERTHLRHRHHLHRVLVLLAAAANPLLWRLPDAAVLAGERWADEAAAAHCTHRSVVATAVAGVARHRAALSADATVVLAAGSDHLRERIRALELPPPRLRPELVVALVVLLVATLLATLDAAHDTEQLLDVAQSAYGLRHR